MEWSEELSGGLLRAAPDAIVVVEAGRVALVNDRAEQLFGCSRDQLVGRLAEELLSDGGLDAYVSQVRPSDTDGPLGSAALSLRRFDGSEFPADVSLSAVPTPQGRFVVAVVRDVTQARRAATEQALLASIVQSSHDAIVSMSLGRTILSWNAGAERLYGYTDMLGRPADQLVPPERRGEEQEIVKIVAEGGRVDRYRAERIRRDGSTIVVSMSVSPLHDAAGVIVGVTAMARDFGERERAEARFQALLEAAPDPLVGVDSGGVVVLATRQAERCFDVPRHQLIGRPVQFLLPAGLPTTSGVTGPGGEALRGRRRDGTTFPVDVALSTLQTEDGTITCAAIRDISERLRAEAERLQLRAEADRQRLEAQLHRTRRLESLGQLAGGVAHDFNNMLGVIINYAGFVIEEAESPSADLAAIGTDAQQILRAGQRGTDLTHQLLAFARREVVRPQVLDLNEVIGDVEQLLRRSLGEHVTLTTELAADLPAVSADPGQLEQLLVNLALNARDAMPSGGRLVIDTGTYRVDDVEAAYHVDLTPGEYVRLRVSDSGTGMSPEVVERAFEPFFTTRANGEGTGLGLATVYGIVAQAGGSVSIASELGVGSTFTVLLAATDQTPERAGEPEPRATGGRGETLLVVEDEDALRDVVCRILSGAGYRVLSADGGPQALALAGRHDGPIDLLVSDVVMPGMLGKDLAEQLVGLRPDTRVLYMSGYAQPVLASQGTLDPGVMLLEKPFTGTDLLRAVRHRLDH